jgi:hypothetical protein
VITMPAMPRQAIPVLDLPLPDPPPAGAEWIAVCRPTVDCLPLSSSARTSGTELRVLGAEEVLARIPGDTASLHWVDQAG